MQSDKSSTGHCCDRHKTAVYLLCVVKHFGVGVQRKVLHGLNLRHVPAVGLGPVNFDHVVAAVVAKHQLVPGGL